MKILEKTLRFQYFPQEFEDFLQESGILIFEVQKKYENQNQNHFFIFFNLVNNHKNAFLEVLAHSQHPAYGRKGRT